VLTQAEIQAFTSTQYGSYGASPLTAAEIAAFSATQTTWMAAAMHTALFGS
jgi:hypothetical protein